MTDYVFLEDCGKTWNLGVQKPLNVKFDDIFCGFLEDRILREMKKTEAYL